MDKNSPPTTIASLPSECINLILSNIPGRTTARLRRLNATFKAIVEDDTTWYSKCAEFGIDVKGVQRLLRAKASELPFHTLRELYSVVLAPYGHLVGVFQGNQPRFNSQLLRIRFDVARGRVIATQVVAKNSLGPSEEMRELTGKLSAHIEYLKPVFHEKPLFEIVFKKHSESEAPVEKEKEREHGSEVKDEAEEAESALEPAGEQRETASTASSIGEPMFSCAFKHGYLIGGKSLEGGKYRSIIFCIRCEAATKEPTGERSTPTTTECDHGLVVCALSRIPENEAAPEITSSPASRLSASSFGSSSSSDAASVSGITDAHSIHNDTPQPPALIQYGCGSDCQDLGRQSVFMRIKTKSIDVAPPPAMPVKPLEGIWVGTYGAHGIEFLLLKYMFRRDLEGFDDRPDPDAESSECSSADDDGSQVVLAAHKITGDVNVPMGETSWVGFLGDGSGSDMIGKDPDDHDDGVFAGAAQPGRASLRDIEELRDCRAFKGKATVAMVGYRFASKISCDVIVISPTEICVFWHALANISPFVYVGDALPTLCRHEF
ncbi:hypothetical protein HK102_003901 [Quaeritorhiza haematococci]|nr:hypothetical protein HK102_003901 [Quaeritorhiza haematococci]